MKHGLLLVTAAVILSITPALAYNKNEATAAVADTETVQKNLEANQLLGPHMPFDIFRDGAVNLIQARAFLDSGNYDDAYYHASVARVRFETADLVAQSRLAHYQRLIVLSEAYTAAKDRSRSNSAGKDGARKEGSSDGGSMAESGFFPKGDAYRAEVYDWQLFAVSKNRIVHILSSDGKKRIDVIINILNDHPDSKIKIVGHTADFDARQTSKRKAEVVGKYFLEKKIPAGRIEIIGMGNREVTVTPAGYRRAARVEFIISGYK